MVLTGISVLTQDGPHFPESGARLFHFVSCKQCLAAGGILSHHGPYNIDPKAVDVEGRQIPLWPPAVE